MEQFVGGHGDRERIEAVLDANLLEFVSVELDDRVRPTDLFDANGAATGDGEDLGAVGLQAIVVADAHLKTAARFDLINKRADLPRQLAAECRIHTLASVTRDWPRRFLMRLHSLQQCVHT